MQKIIPLLVFACGLVTAVASTAAEPGVNVQDLGAVADGKTHCTQAIQKAIDRCNAAGGGTVYFPAGTYLSGTIFLKSRVTLNLAAGATLLGSGDLADYPLTLPKKVQSRTNTYIHRSLIYAEDLDQIAIVGRGVIDGNGRFYKVRSVNGTRPLILRVIDCRDVLLENITMRNAGFWNQHYLLCQRVMLRGIRVWNHATYNADGLDIDGCRDFILTDSFIDSDDDAVCLKSTSERPCENVVISNCVLSSHCDTLKFGTDSSGGFLNITIANCSIVSPRGTKAMNGLQRGRSGLSFELVDGGKIDRVAVSNVTIDGVETPIFVRLGNRGTGYVIEKDLPKKEVPVGTLRNVSFSNIVATRAGQTGCSVVGLADHCIENVSFNNVLIRSEGGGKKEWADAKIEELSEKYPQATMFGNLPAHGLYCRHVRGLTLSDVRLETDEPDGRHALAMDDVQEANVSGLSCSQAPVAAALVGLRQARNVLIRGCRPDATDGVFVRLAGKDTEGVSLIGNDLSHVGQTSEFADGATASSLRSAENVLKE